MSERLRIAHSATLLWIRLSCIKSFYPSKQYNNRLMLPAPSEYLNILTIHEFISNIGLTLLTPKQNRFYAHKKILYIKCCEHVKTRSMHDLSIQIASALMILLSPFLRSTRFIFVNRFCCSQITIAERFCSSWYSFSHIFDRQLMKLVVLSLVWAIIIYYSKSLSRPVLNSERKTTQIHNCNDRVYLN